jgi:16S rRNA (guanine527-N7)-methyltransferase
MQDDVETIVQNLGLNVSRETFLKISLFVSLLRRWQQKTNLVAATALEDLEHRHILDSLQLLKFIPPHSCKIIDLGSGAGFPGLILALTDRYEISLVEKNHKKCAFLKQVLQETKTSATVYNQKIEMITNLKGGIITSRALASLSELLTYAYPLSTPTTECLFLKGERADEEIEKAAIDWQFEIKKYTSLTDPSGVILSIKNFSRK